MTSRLAHELTPGAEVSLDEGRTYLTVVTVADGPNDEPSEMILNLRNADGSVETFTVYPWQRVLTLETDEEGRP